MDIDLLVGAVLVGVGLVLVDVRVPGVGIHLVELDLVELGPGEAVRRDGYSVAAFAVEHRHPRGAFCFRLGTEADMGSVPILS